MGRKRQYDHLLAEMVAMREAGKSYYAIAKKFKINQRTVKKYIQRSFFQPPAEKLVKPEPRHFIVLLVIFVIVCVAMLMMV